MTRNYMKTEEFKARQLWLPFVDSFGIALQVMAESIEKTRNWFKSWKKSFKAKTKIEATEQQLLLNFEKRNYNGKQFNLQLAKI